MKIVQNCLLNEWILVETLEDGLIHGTLDKMTFFRLFFVAIGGKVE